MSAVPANTLHSKTETNNRYEKARILYSDRTAGEAVIRRIAGNMEEPEFSEGFDIIDTYDENGELISHRTKEEE